MGLNKINYGICATVVHQTVDKTLFQVDMSSPLLVGVQASKWVKIGEAFFRAARLKEMEGEPEVREMLFSQAWMSMQMCLDQSSSGKRPLSNKTYSNKHVSGSRVDMEARAIKRSAVKILHAWANTLHDAKEAEALFVKATQVEHSSITEGALNAFRRDQVQGGERKKSI